jgi:hypothetical protein
MSSSQVSGIFPTDDWVVAEATSGGSPLIIRMRSSLPTQADQSLLCHLVVVKWAYEPNEQGMPDSKYHKQMNVFEDALEAGTERRQAAVQAASLTGGGEKEWRYYTHDVDAFMASMNADLVGHSQYPLKIDTFLDAEWSALRDLQGSACDA